MISIPENSELYFNLGLIGFYVLMMIAGYRKGFFRAVVAFCGNLLSLFVAFRYCTLADQYFRLWPSAWTPFQNTLAADTIYRYFNEVAWFVLIFAVLKLLFYILEKLIAGIQKIPVISEISGLLGALLGACSATIWVLVICVILSTPLFSNGSDVLQKTWLGKVQEASAEVLAKAGIRNEMEAVNQIYEAAGKLDNKDKQAVEEWLQDHGYQKISTATDKQSVGEGSR